LVEINTKRLTLRPFQLIDVPNAYEWLGDPRVMAGMPAGVDKNQKITTRRISSYITHQGRYGFSKWLVIERRTSLPIGDAGLLVIDATGEIDLGFRLKASLWGNGYGSEIALAWLDAGFNCFGLDRITAIAEAQNIASQNLLQKVGFKEFTKELFLGINVFRYEIRK
jgi:ribosomal-protein-alanine N-acetyltransferase